MNGCRFYFLLTFFVGVSAFAGAGDLELDPRLETMRGARSRIVEDPDVFQFAILPDRSGGAREGVFEAAAEKVNRLRPDFIINVGDLIDGTRFTSDPEEVRGMWQEMEQVFDRLDMPFFLVPGNHDYAKQTLGTYYRDHVAPPFYYFVYKNVLFLILNTEEQDEGFDNTIIRPEQVEYFREVIAGHPEVRWTFLFMHRPMWRLTPPVEGFVEIEKMLAGRPYTVFAGHWHGYHYVEIDGRDYFNLATAGGGSTLRGEIYGQFDHLTWVTMTEEGPHVSTIPLDAVYGNDVMAEAREKMTQRYLAKVKMIGAAPVLIDPARPETIERQVQFKNESDMPVELDVSFDDSPALDITPASFAIKMQPGAAGGKSIRITVDQPDELDGLKAIGVNAKARILVPDSEALEGKFGRWIPAARHFVARRWDFSSEDEGWYTMGECERVFAEGQMRLKVAKTEPSLTYRIKGEYPLDELELRLRMRSTSGDQGRLYIETASAKMSAATSIVFPIKNDGEWHELMVSLTVEDPLKVLRFDMFSQPGTIDLDWIELRRVEASQAQ